MCKNREDPTLACPSDTFTENTMFLPATCLSVRSKTPVS